MRKYLPERWKEEQTKREASRVKGYARTDAKRKERAKVVAEANKGFLSYKEAKKVLKPVVQRLAPKIKGVYSKGTIPFQYNSNYSFLHWLRDVHAPVVRHIVKDMPPADRHTLLDTIERHAEQGNDRLTRKQKDDLINKINSKSVGYKDDERLYNEAKQRPTSKMRYFADSGGEGKLASQASQALPETEWRSAAPPNAVYRYLRGKCADFAMALQKETGLPLYGLFDSSGGLHHVFARKGGMAYDIRGAVPLEKVSMGSIILRKGSEIRPVSKAEVEKVYGVPDRKERSEARAAVRRYVLNPLIRADSGAEGYWLVPVEEESDVDRQKNDDHVKRPVSKKPHASEPAAKQRAAGGRVVGANIEKNPTEGQKEAGNYAKDHISVDGFNITIENAKGHKRSGVGADGKSWECELPCDYGYFKRTEGSHGDHVDVYLGPHRKSLQAFVIDQINPDTGKFDEHKVLLWFGSEKQATATYKRAFSDGKGFARIGAVSSLSLPLLKVWLKHGDTKKPFSPNLQGKV